MYERRNQQTNGIICFDDVEAESVIGILPCSQSGCDERTGVACVELDGRGRLCPTAWCTTHRHVSGGEPLCPFHALRHEPRVRLGAVHPLTDLVERFADLAEDDVATVLQAQSVRSGGVLVAEPLQAEMDAECGLSCWRAWRVDAASGTAVRVTLSGQERRPDVIVIAVDGVVVNTVAAARDLLPLAEAGQDVLLREVLAPVSLAIECRRFEHSTDLPGIGQMRNRARR